jgi:hypothetical protein
MVLIDVEMKRPLSVIGTTHYCKQNRLPVMLSYLAGLRVGGIAGHKHLSTTQRYIHVNDVMLRQAVE